jgi:hypothetical protein
MNPLLKIAYDYGCQKAVEDFEKSADWKADLVRRLSYDPMITRGALGGGLVGGAAGAMNAEEGHGLRGFLAGAAGGAALGAGAGKLSQKHMDTDLLDNIGYKDWYLGLGKPLGSNGARLYDTALKEIAESPFASQIPKAYAGLGAAGLAGGLGAGALSGANDKPWYQRMNPFG